MALSWPAALLGGELFIIGAFATRFVSLGSIAAVVGTYALMILFTIFYNWPLEFLLYALVGTIVIIVMHRGNINRLLAGNERRLGEKAEELQEHTSGEGEG
jgi:glycerol-3-phosphate acyltransferase PlsY